MLYLCDVKIVNNYIKKKKMKQVKFSECKDISKEEIIKCIVAKFTRLDPKTILIEDNDDLCVEISALDIEGNCNFLYFKMNVTKYGVWSVVYGSNKKRCSERIALSSILRLQKQYYEIVYRRIQVPCNIPITSVYSNYEILLGSPKWHKKGYVWNVEVAGDEDLPF